MEPTHSRANKTLVVRLWTEDVNCCYWRKPVPAKCCTVTMGTATSPSYRDSGEVVQMHE